MLERNCAAHGCTIGLIVNPLPSKLFGHRRTPSCTPCSGEAAALHANSETVRFTISATAQIDPQASWGDRDSRPATPPQLCRRHLHIWRVLARWCVCGSTRRRTRKAMHRLALTSGCAASVTSRGSSVASVPIRPSSPWKTGSALLAYIQMGSDWAVGS